MVKDAYLLNELINALCTAFVRFCLIDWIKLQNKNATHQKHFNFLFLPEICIALL